jgi:small-conductance mechanosensitive channel
VTAASFEQIFAGWLAGATLGKLVTVAAALLVLATAVWVLRWILCRSITDPGTLYRAKKFAAALGYVAGLLVIVFVFSDRLGQAAVAVGVAGAGLAFALKEVIASVAGWAAIAMGDFYKTGDRVQVGEIKGDVIDIGMLRTTLMEIGQWVNADLYTGRIVKIANSVVFKEPVFNYSGDFPFLWDEIAVPVKYGSDYRLARQTFERVVEDVAGDYARHAKSAWADLVRQYLIEPAEIDPRVYLVANDNWMEFSVRYVVDYKQRRLTKDRLFTRLLEEIDRTGGRVALASATFHLVEAPELKVTLTNPAREAATERQPPLGT